MKTRYIWQLPEWPCLRFDTDRLITDLAALRKNQGAFLGKMHQLGFEDGLSAWSTALEEDAIQTAAIEGQALDRQGVRSSLALHLGLPCGGLRVADRSVDGLVSMLLDASKNHEDMTCERLFGWQASLFPTGWSDLYKVETGQWRSGEMQVVSGAYGRQTIHYEAPPCDAVDSEMNRFLQWLSTEDDIDGVIKAGLAHLRFVTIHPFSDGNGRIARAIADYLLARDDGVDRRYYSVSAAIMAKREEYYSILEKTQKGDGDCTEWLSWFIGRVQDALSQADSMAERIVFKSRFWNHFQNRFNERQRKVLNRLMDAGQNGFEGGLTTRKYVAMAKTSRATAWRDIDELLSVGSLRSLSNGGKKQSYEINWDILS